MILVPTSSSAPNWVPDCSCGAGEFKFQLELKTDLAPGEISWKIQDENGDILFTDPEYSEEHTIFSYKYCLPVGCYDFIIKDSVDDGICCGNGEGYYNGTIYGWDEVFFGGDFGSQAIESFCGDDKCPFATHYPSQNPVLFK